MDTCKLGTSGLTVSRIGLGCNNFGWRIDTDAARRVVDAAIDHGITLFDTADSYGQRGGSETALGEILGKRRADIVLATKFGMPMDDEGKRSGASRRYIMAAAEASLKRLKTDWIDLYQLHKPDPTTPIEETLGALDDLVRQGKVRYIGCSNVPGWGVADAAWTSRSRGFERFVSVQDEYSLLSRGIERELIPAARHFGAGLLPFFPLAGGLLTGKYRRDAMPEGARLTTTPGMASRFVTDANWAIIERLQAFSAERGHTLLELAFSWLLAQPVTASVIAGATRPEQIASNVDAGNWKLTDEDLAAVRSILEG